MVDEVGVEEEEEDEETTTPNLIIKFQTHSEKRWEKMNEKKTLKLDNRDTTEQMIVFEDQNFFTVAPNTVREINITEAFGKGQGIYRYRCGEQEKAVGILYVVK